MSFISRVERGLESVNHRKKVAIESDLFSMIWEFII